MNLSETYGETSGFHATIPFINEVEPNPEQNAQVENTTAVVIENVFLEIMSDYVSDPEQSAEIASASQANSARASPIAPTGQMTPKLRHKVMPGLQWM